MTDKRIKSLLQRALDYMGDGWHVGDTAAGDDIFCEQCNGVPPEVARKYLKGYKISGHEKDCVHRTLRAALTRALNA